MFLYSLPTKILYGMDSRLQVPTIIKDLGLKRLLLVTDKGICASGLLQEMEDMLHNHGIFCEIFNELDFEPSTKTVDAGVKKALFFQCDGILGFGGGSPLDAAKAIALITTNGGQVRDYFGVERLKHPPLPMIAIPTTSGTGSEATCWALIRDDEKKEKLGIGCWETMPSYSICDPILTKGMPPPLTASTGMDALTHAIEALVNINCQPISQALALQSISLIANHLRLAVARGDNLEARDAMLMGSLTAALAFNVPGVTSVHAISHVVGAHCGIPHGVANGILLPHVMEFSLMGAPKEFALIGEAMGEGVSGLGTMEKALYSVEAVKALLHDIGLSQGLSSMGLISPMIPEIAEAAIKSSNNLLNPRSMRTEDIASILQKALGGIS